MRKNWLRPALSGAAAGVLNGLFGAGGGMVLVPLLTGFCGVSDRRAFPTALAVILPLCTVSLAVYALGGNLELRGAAPYLCGGVLGGLAGGALFRRVPVQALHRMLGALILYGGVRRLVS